MGFLLGAFGKMAAGSRYRSLQARAMRIQSKLRRASNQVKHMEDMISRQEKYMQNYLTTQASNYKYGLNAWLQSEYQSILSKTGGGNATTGVELSAEDREKLSGYQQAAAQGQYMVDMQTTMMKQQIESQMEWMRDNMLEPLKQEEDHLQSEKDSIETQLETAKLDYEACKKMEQTDAQMMKPDYTGGQG